MDNILIIEDDKVLCNEIKLFLEKWGYKVGVICNFENILNEFIKFNSRLVIMDVNLPFYDGFYWCRKIREVSSVPIIFLSSRDSNMDLMMGINNGGDDYIQKPFVPEVLLSKIHAIMRRTYNYSNSPNNIIIYGDIILDVEKGQVTYKENKLDLTRNELKILTIFMKNKGKIVSRNKLMLALWEEDEFVNDNALTVNINRLRNRFKEIGVKDLIVTKKGIGYMIK